MKINIFMVRLTQRLRKHSTDSEQLLWKYLRSDIFQGLKFRRQHPLGLFVVDFVCLSHHLVVEIDGGIHLKRKRSDQAREEWLTKEGYRVLRFWDNEVFKNVEEVIRKIKNTCFSPSSISSPPGRRDKEVLI